MHASDAYADPRFNPDVDVLTGFRTKSILCMPVRLATAGASQTLAVLQVLNKVGGSAFDESDIDMMQVFSNCTISYPSPLLMFATFADVLF